MLRRVRLWRRAIWGSVAAFLVPPVLGLAGFLIGMLQAFANLSASGQADPNVLANNLSTSLLSSFWASLVSLLALPVLILTITMHHRSKRAISINR